VTCVHCIAAAGHPHHGRSTVDCLGCKARRLALSPHAFAALAGAPEQLQADIAEIWGDDYKAGRAEVWRWLEIIKAARPKGD